MKPLSVFLAFGALTLPIAPPLFSKALDIPTDPTRANKPVTIKILLHDREPDFLLEVKGPHKIFCPESDILLSSSSSAKRALIRPTTSGLSWGEVLPGSKGIRIVPSDRTATIFVNGIQYKGCLEIYDIGGSLRAINEAGVEDFLKSCVATASYDSEESEVLNALAIVLRTQTYYKVAKEPSAAWHVTAAESGYRGFAVTFQNLRMEKAIASTTHAILTYQNEPFPAEWTENSAGVTASFSSIFKNGVAAPKGVKIEGMESERLKSAWSFRMAKDQLAKLAKLAQVSSVSTFSEKSSGKVYAVKIDGAPEGKTLDFFALQNAVGKSKLKSNDFTVELLDNEVRFNGYGEGAGVGLCLRSATLMAKQGFDAKKILSKFFADAKIEKMERLRSK